MPPIRSFAFALTVTSFAGGCADIVECPATGVPLSSGVPEVLPEYGPGCIDAESWIAEVEPANATWTVELRRRDELGFGGGLYVDGLLDGVAVTVGTELILLDSEGNELTSRPLTRAANWSNFVATEPGQMVFADQANGVPQYRVYGPTGAEVWLRLLDVDSPIGAPGLHLAADGSLWIGLTRFTADFQEIEVEIQHWAVTGSMQSQVVLSGVSNSQFARDGAGNFAVIDETLELFAADGSPIGFVDFGDTWIGQVIGLDDGFVAGGSLGRVPLIARVDGQGSVVWQQTLPSNYVEDPYAYVAGLAALPGGGVVAVGIEDTIEFQYPDSPLIYDSQPFVLALDDDGAPTWGERIAAAGRAFAVSVGSQGEVYVVGTAQASEPNEYGSAAEIAWLRRYDP